MMKNAQIVIIGVFCKNVRKIEKQRDKEKTDRKTEKRAVKSCK